VWIPPAYSPLSPTDALGAFFAGPRAPERLEALLAERYGADAVVLTRSGTAALQLALERATGSEDAARDRRERAVALPAYGCYDLLTAVVGAGRPVHFYDVDPDTLGPEPTSLARAAERARVVVVANLYGSPLDWTAIRSVSDEAGSVVVEDAAQGVGARSDAGGAGALGDLTVLSFGRGKGWMGGGGGALLDRRRDVAEPAPLPAADASRVGHLASSLAVWLLARPSLYGIPARTPGLALGETHYRPPAPLRGIHPSQAALALATRTRALDAVVERRRRAGELAERWRRLGGSLPDADAFGESGYLRLPIFLMSPPSTGGARERRLRRGGIYGAYPRPLPEVAARFGLVERGSGAGTPGAEWLARHLATAPTHGRVRTERVVAAMRREATGSSGPSGPEESIRPQGPTPPGTRPAPGGNG